ncbi:uncharacterized 2Fe-2S/4Fe-4S cluster protein (DUF4445 family) [Anaerotaenia torta]|uniref:ASKHA domain-containing protein n=1 Tax=Anaerotaenia torta TaxID=433293 RepID=UPI003D2241FF
MLLRSYGADWDQVAKVYLAGGFGFVLDISKAIHVGLLPEELKDKFITVGNSPLPGRQDMPRTRRLAGINTGRNIFQEDKEV